MATIKELIKQSVEPVEPMEGISMRTIELEQFLISMAGIIVYICNELLSKDFPEMTATAGNGKKIENMGGGKGIEEVSVEDIESFLFTYSDFFRRMQLSAQIRAFIDYLLKQEQPSNDMWYDSEWLCKIHNQMCKEDMKP